MARYRELIERLADNPGGRGRIGEEAAGLLYDLDRDAEAADALEAADDELDDLHVSLTAELVSGQLTVPVATEMTLIARYYERLGDHAVNVAKRIRFLAIGSSPSH